MFIFQKRSEINEWLNPPPNYVSTMNEEVILYSTEQCGYCKKARELMDEKGIPYLDYDINRSTEAKNEWKSLGGKGVPVLVINNKVIHGYNRKKIIAYAGE